MKTRFSIIVLLAWLSLPLAPQIVQKNADVAKDTLHVIGHSHMDMNWLWTLSETEKMAHDNLRQAIAFMEEYPDYHLLQSEAVVYKMVEEQDPELFSKVKKYVKEGRFEPVGGMWVESDQQMPSGEALTRSFLLGQRYFQSRFGRMARVGWLPDDFGHQSQLPQMLRQCGMNYFGLMRTAPHTGAFWWEGADGSRVLAFSTGSYNGDINEGLRDRLQAFPVDGHRSFCPTGEGDHGGGPTRLNIERTHELDARPDYPSVRFTTAEAFFKMAEKEAIQRPTHKGEMGYVFEGCYSNVAEIKEFNRKCENVLYEDEYLQSLNWMRGGKYPAEKLTSLWEGVAFNQFHDILPGSAIYESNRESVGRYNDIFHSASQDRDYAFRAYVDNIPFLSGAGQPIVAFNFLPYQHRALVEAEVFSYDLPMTTSFHGWGNFDAFRTIFPRDGLKTTVLVRDTEGKTYPAQIVWGKRFPPGWRWKVEFVCDDIPAGGYKTFYVDPSQKGTLEEDIPFHDNTFETDFYRIKIDPQTGNIVSLIDKASGKDFVTTGKQLNTLRMYTEMKGGEMKSWTINRSTSRGDITTTTGKASIENGPIRAKIEANFTWGNSRFRVFTYIYRSLPRIDYEIDARWLEYGTGEKDSPMLRAVFPINMPNSTFWNDVAFNVVERPHDGMLAGQPTPVWLQNREDPGTVEREDGQEVAAQKWVDVSDGKAGFALLNRSKYGHCYNDGELRMTLLRSAGDPDEFPNLGKFNIQYAIMLVVAVSGFASNFQKKSNAKYGLLCVSILALITYCYMGYMRQSAESIFAVFPLLAVLITPILGSYVDHKGKAASMLVLGSLLLIACHLTFAFVLPAFRGNTIGGIIIAYITILVLGASFSLVPASLWPSVPKLVEPKIIGSAYALIFWIQNIGLWLFPLLIGKVLDKTNPDIVNGLDNNTITPEQAAVSYDYTWPLVMLAALGVAALLLGLLLKVVDKKKGLGLEEPNIK